MNRELRIEELNDGYLVLVHSGISRHEIGERYACKTIQDVLARVEMILKAETPV